MTISQYKLPIKLFIFNNRCLGMVELEMQVAGLPDWQTKMVNPNFSKIGTACGMKTFTISNPDDAKSSIEEALEHNGPVLVEVFTNPFVPVLPPHTSVGVLSRYIEAQIKLTASGRWKDVWRSIKTAMQYTKDIK